MRQIVRKLLPILRQLMKFLCARGHLRWRRLTTILILLTCKRTYPVGLRALFFCKPASLPRQRIQLAGLLLLLRSTQQVRRLTKPLCRASRLLRALLPSLLLTARTTHRLIGSTQTLQRLLHSRISVSIFGIRTRRRARLRLLRLTLLPLPLLSLRLRALPRSTAACTLLSALLPLLPLHLFHVALQLLGLTPQHLLLPPLLEVLCLVLLLLRQLLLPLGQSIQLLQRLVYLLRLLLCSRARLRRLILVLLGVEFQVKQARKIASRTTATTTAAPSTLTERHLNLPERSLRSQQRLLRQLIRRRHHSRGGRLHILLKTVELLIRIRKIPALHSSGERQRLLPQL